MLRKLLLTILFAGWSICAVYSQATFVSGPTIGITEDSVWNMARANIYNIFANPTDSNKRAYKMLSRWEKFWEPRISSNALDGYGTTESYNKSMAEMFTPFDPWTPVSGTATWTSGIRI